MKSHLWSVCLRAAGIFDVDVGRLRVKVQVVLQTHTEDCWKHNVAWHPLANNSAHNQYFTINPLLRSSGWGQSLPTVWVAQNTTDLTRCRHSIECKLTQAALKKAKAKDPTRATRAHRAALISVSIVLSQTPQPKLQVHGHGTSVSRGVPV